MKLFERAPGQKASVGEAVILSLGVTAGILLFRGQLTANEMPVEPSVSCESTGEQEVPIVIGTDDAVTRVQFVGDGPIDSCVAEVNADIDRQLEEMTARGETDYSQVRPGMRFIVPQVVTVRYNGTDR